MSGYDGPERRRRPTDWLREELAALKDEGKERHERLRADMQSGFLILGEKLEAHAEDDRKVADRVLIIETRREEEAKQTVRRGTFGGILAGGGIAGLFRLIDLWWKH